MRIRLLLAALLVIALFAPGCGGKEKEDDPKAAPPTSRSIDNNAPEARNAPAAPSDPSIRYPGGMKGGAKKGGQ